MVKRSSIVLMALFALVSWGHADGLTLETAFGIGSNGLPLPTTWTQRLGQDGAYFREWAVRGTYQVQENVSVSMSMGWINDLNILTGLMSITGDDGPFPPDAGSRYLTRNVYYVMPTLNIITKIVRFSMGGIAYAADFDDKDAGGYNAPFNHRNNPVPSIGAELGEQDLYFVFKYFDSFPLYSGGGGYEIGMAHRTLAQNEHKFYATWSESFHGYGYRGEFGVSHDMAVTAGLAVGWAYLDESSRQWTDDKYILMLGFKYIR